MLISTHVQFNTNKSFVETVCLEDILFTTGSLALQSYCSSCIYLISKKENCPWYYKRDLARWCMSPFNSSTTIHCLTSLELGVIQTLKVFDELVSVKWHIAGQDSLESCSNNRLWGGLDYLEIDQLLCWDFLEYKHTLQ